MVRKMIVNRIKYRGFTDRLYFLNLCFAWVFTIISITLCFVLITHQYSDASSFCNMCEIIGGLVWTELGVHTALVVHKAKVENLSKWAGKDLAKNASMDVHMDI